MRLSDDEADRSGINQKAYADTIKTNDINGMLRNMPLKKY